MTSAKHPLLGKGWGGASEDYEPDASLGGLGMTVEKGDALREFDAAVTALRVQYADAIGQLAMFETALRHAQERPPEPAPTPAPSVPQTAPEVQLKEALETIEALQAVIQRRVCFHESTHRGGVLWEICDDCGVQWSDDRNPKPAVDEDLEIYNASIKRWG
jgi:hypothetical protein